MSKTCEEEEEIEINVAQFAMSAPAPASADFRREEEREDERPGMGVEGPTPMSVESVVLPTPVDIRGEEGREEDSPGVFEGLTPPSDLSSRKRARDADDVGVEDRKKKDGKRPRTLSARQQEMLDIAEAIKRPLEDCGAQERKTTEEGNGEGEGDGGTGEVGEGKGHLRRGEGSEEGAKGVRVEMVWDGVKGGDGGKVGR